MFFVKIALILFLIGCIASFTEHCRNDRHEAGYMVLFCCAGDVAWFIIGIIAMFQLWNITINIGA